MTLIDPILDGIAKVVYRSVGNFLHGRGQGSDANNHWSSRRPKWSRQLLMLPIAATAKRLEPKRAAEKSRSKQTRVRTHYSHQMTAAARAIAAMKLVMFRSNRVAMRRQSFSLQNMRSMTFRSR